MYHIIPALESRKFTHKSETILVYILYEKENHDVQNYERLPAMHLQICNLCVKHISRYNDGKFYDPTWIT